MNNYPSTWFRHSMTRIVCPLPMTPFDLFITRLFCGGEVSGSLLHYQREAHRVGYDAPPPNAPLLGRSMHSVLGMQPTWLSKQGVTYVPEVYQWVAARHFDGKSRLAPHIFAAEFRRVADREGLPHQSTGNCLRPSNVFLFDVFAILAGFDRGIELTEENFAFYKSLMEYETIQRVLEGGPEEAEAIAVRVCHLIRREGLIPPVLGQDSP